MKAGVARPNDSEEKKQRRAKEGVRLSLGDAEEKMASPQTPRCRAENNIEIHTLLSRTTNSVGD